MVMALRRLMQIRWDATWGEGSYGLKPEWNRRKQHPWILDLRRLFWRHRARFCKLWLELEELRTAPTTTRLAAHRGEIAV
jgi:hypothetical protein